MSELGEREFERAADAALQAIDRALSDESDFEVELTMGILTLEFPDGTTYVVNSHRAAKQIWMAADRVAWHFDLAPGDASAAASAGKTEARWVAAKSGDELHSTLEAAVTKKLGRPFRLAK